ncbi:phage tail sheath family protein [Shewanella sp. YLB-07]|uniref:phage tail sheath family protein n=1 Tax=Shewanella sp. YLB-07 TaxID=2601268 RepID=UPI0012C197C3|nr:phage tail sheath C-terminal domain-containing protein [Shewanella sp. YLB-07]MPY24388.1 phage tail sheath family protein [Shewanella sp. YLB-07]
MTITTSYPGVYLEELNSMSLSVSSSATAVPVFAISDTDAKFSTTTRISSWMDYMNRLGGPFNPDDVRDASIRTYFENGGGYCYLVPLGKLEVEVPDLDDATLLVSAGQDIQSAVATLCVEGKNLFAILDGPTHDVREIAPLPDGATATGNEDINDWKNAYDETAYSAIYYPWLNAKWASVTIPPSAAIAGIYCQNDSARGVWKAPANVPLRGGVLPVLKVNDDFQGQHTSGGKALNMVRQFNNGSPVIWGTRTCVDNDSWRYVPVRRLFNSAEKDIQNSMKTMMFEPNSQPTWERVRSAITLYLYTLWQQGALAGSTDEEAFFVDIGKDITMNEADISQGKMIVKVGMAAVRPAEFIILQFTQDVDV